MAKSLIRNVLGGETSSFALPADGAAAKAFCDNHLEGTYAVYEVESTSGNEVEAKVFSVTVTGKNKDTHRKTTFSFYSKSDKDEEEIVTALKGGTFNGVKFDEVYVIDMAEITLS